MSFMNSSLFVSYLIVITVLILTPGPDMLFIFATGIRNGPWAGFSAAIGVCVGEVVHLTAAAFGLAALFRAAPMLYDGLRIAGAIYLIWLGIRTVLPGGRSVAPAVPDLTQRSTSDAPVARKAFWRGVLTNLLNPKMALFSIAFFPQFVDASRGNVALQFLVLGACFILVEILIDGPVGLAAGRFRQLLTRRRRVTRAMDVCSGSIFLGLGAKLAVTRW
jgi:threonine/homoserine/homoserine lactone efflux protein